ncbi:hypothetical protein JGI15_11341, partial [Candidatus Kryptonium thompsonii]
VYGDLIKAEEIIRQLYNNPNRIQMGVNGFEYVKRHFERDMCIQKLLKYLK